MLFADNPARNQKRAANSAAGSSTAPDPEPQRIRSRARGRWRTNRFLLPLILVFTFNFLAAEAALKAGCTSADLDASSLLSADYGVWEDSEFFPLRRDLIEAVAGDNRSGGKNPLALQIEASEQKSFLQSSSPLVTEYRAQPVSVPGGIPLPAVEVIPLPAAGSPESGAGEEDLQPVVIVGPAIGDVVLSDPDFEEAAEEAREAIEETPEEVGAAAGGGGLLPDSVIQEQLGALRDLQESGFISTRPDSP